MSRMQSLGMILAVSGVVGCGSSSRLESKVGAALPVEKVELGMTLDDAVKQLGAIGQEQSYEALPTNPRPRDAYWRLPGLTKWFVWSKEGSPLLILGVDDGKVVYKQVARQEGNGINVEA